MSLNRPANAFIYERAGPEHHCIVLQKSRRNRQTSVGFHVDDASDLRKLAALPDASPIEETNEPGGGKRVSFLNPDGMRVDAIHGRAVLPELEPAPTFDINSAGPAPDNLIRVNEGVRIAGGPAHVYRLGHTVQSARHVDETIRWYQERFGFIVSDFQFADGVPDPVSAFMRCDRGATPSDHHTPAISFGPVLGHMHSAFECRGLDDLMAGHLHLQDRRRRHSRGVGRHLLGSQLFDYWRDPAGDMFEHFADGDRFDADKEAEYFNINARESHFQWGPPMSSDFLGLTPGRMLKDMPGILGRFLKSDDPLTPGKLRKMAKGIKSAR